MNWSLLLRKAAPEDLEKIKEIADSYVLSDKTVEETEQYGFLVSGYSLKDYQSFITYADYFYVATLNNSIIGFLLAYSSSYIKESEWLNNQVKQAYDEPFILIKQVCVDKQHSGSDVASQLYKNLLDSSDNIAIFAAIVLEPNNPRSIHFHEKFNFSQVVTATPADGLLRGMWAARFKNKKLQLKETVEKGK